MPLRFYNSMTRKIEEFIPQNESEVSLYTCGPTVYNFPHIGNLRTFMFEDLLHRWLKYKGYQVHHVMNLTDVDDKTIKNSIAQNMSLQEYTNIYKKAFFEDIESLNMVKAEHYPSATEYVPQMSDMVEKLIKNGNAYETADGVYYRVSSFSDYGKLAHIEQSRLREGASGRVADDEYSKEELSDFALWKKWTPEDGNVKWKSSFGEGRPGWHIECSVMSMSLLGETIDIHCGGIDNLFPHHENEIAQSEAVSGKQFVRYWLHAVHLVVDGEKMSKSKGNFYTLRDLMDKGFYPRSIRYALLTTHYRKPLNFTFDLIRQADSSLKRIDDFLFMLSQLKNVEQGGNQDISAAVKQKQKAFEEALDDDLQISEAMAAVFELIRFGYENQQKIRQDNVSEIRTFFDQIDQVLGILNFHQNDNKESIDLIEKLIQERSEAKQAKDYKKADEIRDRLKEMGIEVRDSKDGTVWKRI